MKPTIAFLSAVMAAALPLASNPAFAHDDDWHADGRLVLSIGSSPLVWVPEDGLYVALGARSPTFYIDGFFFLFDDHHWYRSRRHGGPWARVDFARLPRHLHQFRRGDWPRYQGRAERHHRFNMYRRPPQRGPRQTWRERSGGQRDTYSRQVPDDNQIRRTPPPSRQQTPRNQADPRFDRRREGFEGTRQDDRRDKSQDRERSVYERSNRRGEAERSRDGARDYRRDR